VWRQAARRLALIWGALLAVTLAVSVLLGLATHGNILRSMAVGLYLAGAVLLGGCFVIGARGPLRGQSREGETVSILGASRVRRATGDERSESARTAILLFVLGLSLVILGSLIDPAHKSF
jgi:hypothetical protein